MAHFVLHANDAEAFVKKFGYPDEATPARENVVMRYIGLEDADVKEARELVFNAQKARRAGATGKVLTASEQDDGTLELTVAKVPEAQVVAPPPKRVVSPAGTAVTEKARKEASEKATADAVAHLDEKEDYAEEFSTIPLSGKDAEKGPKQFIPGSSPKASTPSEAADEASEPVENKPLVKPQAKTKESTAGKVTTGAKATTTKKTSAPKKR